MQNIQPTPVNKFNRPHGRIPYAKACCYRLVNILSRGYALATIYYGDIDPD